MVERLKMAIERARTERAKQLEAGPPTGASAAVGPKDRASLWRGLTVVSPDTDHLLSRRIITLAQEDNARHAFNILRTRVMQVCAKNGWRRVAVTSPTSDSGKSTICANLALSIARQSETRCALFDLDLIRPSQATLFGVQEPPFLERFLNGEQNVEQCALRIGDNLALFCNGASVSGSSELLQDPRCAAALDSAISRLDVDVALLDLPPALSGDDVIGAADLIDATIIVVSADTTTRDQVDRCVQLLDGRSAFLGVVFNRYGDDSEHGYYPAS